MTERPSIDGGAAVFLRGHRHHASRESARGGHGGGGSTATSARNMTPRSGTPSARGRPASSSSHVVDPAVDRRSPSAGTRRGGGRGGASSSSVTSHRKPLALNDSPPGALTGNSSNHNPRAHTPSSTRSSTHINYELEEVLGEVLSSRVQSLNDVRQRIDDLADLQTREAQDFLDQMKTVMRQSTLAARQTEEMEQDFELQLRQEKQEREKAVAIMSKFRQEGTAVMSELKNALREVQQKYRSEVERSNRLAMELRRATGSSGAASTNQPPIAGDVSTAAPGESAQLKQKVAQLVGLLEEEDNIIVELQRRCKTLDAKVQTLTRQRDKLLDVDTHHVNSEGFTADLNELLQQFTQLDRSGAFDASTKTTAESTMPYSALVSMSRLLLQKLKAEQRQRLKVEEQAGGMAAAQDQLLKKMEARVKDLERQLVASTGQISVSGRPTPRDGQHPLSPTRVSVRGGPLLTSPRSHPTAASSASFALPPQPHSPSGRSGNHLRRDADQGPRLPLLAPVQGASSQPPPARFSDRQREPSVIALSSGHPSPTAHETYPSHAALRPLEPRQPRLIGLERVGDEDNRAPSSISLRLAADDDNEFGPTSPPVRIPPSQQHQRLPQRHHDAPSLGSVAPPPSHVLSLEEQLNAVTADFHNSVKLWEEALDDEVKESFHPNNNPALKRDNNNDQNQNGSGGKKGNVEETGDESEFLPVEEEGVAEPPPDE